MILKSSDKDPESKVIYEERITKKYSEFVQKHRESLFPYFKTINQVLLFIENESSLNLKRKRMYSKFLEAQLSHFEKLHIYYYIQTEESKLSPEMVNRFELLNDLGKERKIRLELE